jgi:hypothetical protein
MLNLILLLLTSYGINHLFSTEYIFKWLRNILKFKPFDCKRCLSVWIGFILSFIFPIIGIWYINLLICGIISYTTIKITSLILDKNDFMLDE